MFNGYNDSALISYEYNQEREKKSDNVSKYSYGLDGGVQPPPIHPNNRQSEFWSGKPNFINIPNVVKCNCTGCYPSTDNQSYQVDSTRHRPWLPKTFPVPLNGSTESKLPAYQWDSNLNQICYSDSNIPYGQENGGKNSYYRQFQNPNQQSVIISANKQKTEMGYQNGVRQPMMCNPGYDLTKRVNGRSYYDGDKYSVGAYSINQIPRLPVEPYTKAVPSNLNQTRVPSTGHRKENSPQYDHGSKIRPENYYAGLSPIDLKSSGIHVDYSYFNRDSDYYTDIKRNNMATPSRKDCAATQVSLEQHYGRSKHPENLKGCDMFYPNLDKNQMETCIQRIENDGMNRIPRSVTVCNDLRFPDERSQVFPYQSNGPSRNYMRLEYQQFNSPFGLGFQEPDKNQFRALPQQLSSCDQLPQGNNGCIIDPQKANSDKILSQSRTQIVVDTQQKPNYLETIRCEDLTKNGTHKISPLRLLRKKKFISTSQDISSATNATETPALDVRKFWSTWAEEDENVCPTQMVVLDCQNLDPEQAKLLNFYETDPSRPINLENVIIKNPDCVKDNTESVKANEQPVGDEEKQIDIPTYSEPVVKNTDKTPPELPEAFKVSPKKCRSQDHRQKKTEEAMDKWTEKKFDFLKKSEESKAAEIFRYEEEKKKIFERSLSFQQIGSNKIETSQEEINKYEENSQSNSPEGGTTSDLPTSEYRRNKFLDYSDAIVNGCKNNQKIENVEQDDATKAIVKTEESEANLPLEMADILKKITEINFQELKSESVIETKKAKKTKKKKLEQQESDARTDLKLETTSKPTIKFSIQKSHDLKISFKVLNKKYEEEAEREETKPIEDTDTELITLKYKSIQNGGKLSDSKKMKKKLRRKKHAPVLKIKKSKYTEEERDPLGDDDEAKTYLTDGFQVQETVDSAKIKLTFKRRKTNLETEYKINKESLDAICEEDEYTSDFTENGHRKKSTKANKHEICAHEDFESTMGERSGADSDSESFPKNDLKLIPEERPEDLCEFVNSGAVKKEIYGNPTSGTMLPEKRLCEFVVQNDAMEDSKCEIDGEKQVDLIVNCDEVNESNVQDKFSPVENVADMISESFEDEKMSEKIQEISLDSIRSINSPDIETNSEIEKTEDIEASDADEERKENGEGVIESTNENHSNLESSYDVNNKADALDVKRDLEPVLRDKSNVSLELGSDNSVGFDVTNENASEKGTLENRIESENVCILEENLEDNLDLKLVQGSFVECDSTNEGTEDFQSDFEKDVSISKVVENKSNVEIENTLECPLNVNNSENHFDCLEENAKSEPDLSRICEEVSLMDKSGDEEQSELSKTKTFNELLLNENIQQSSHKITGVDESLENSEHCEDQDNDENSDIENDDELKRQSIDLPKYGDEDSKPSAKDQGINGDLDEIDKKNFPNESELPNCEHYEMEEQFNDLDANKFRPVRLTSEESKRIELDITLNLDSHKIIVDESLTEQQTVHQRMEFTDSLINKNTEELTTPSTIVQLEDINQGSQTINEENTTSLSDIEEVISISEPIKHENVNTEGQAMEVVSNSQNPFSDESATEVINPFRSPESCESEVTTSATENLVLSAFDNQNIEVLNLDELENCSQLTNEEVETQDLSKANNSPTNCKQGNIQHETFEEEPNEVMVHERTEIDFVRIENNIINNFQDDEEKQAQLICLEKLDESDKPSEELVSNEIKSLPEEQKNIIVIENLNQSGSVTMSSVGNSGINSSLTVSTEIKLDEQTTSANNPSPQLNKLESNCLEVSSNLESDLEDGEIVEDSSDESEPKKQTASSFSRKTAEFKIQKPSRRHSVYLHNGESHSISSWCQRKFIKSKSCPPKFNFDLLENYFNIAVKDIPLPVGPPPLSSCFSFNKSYNEERVSEEAKENTEHPSAELIGKMNQNETVEKFSSRPQFVGIKLENCKNPSPLQTDAFGAQRSKIKFSLVKRSRFSKIGLHYGKAKVLDPPKLVENTEPNITLPAKDTKPEVTKNVEEPESAEKTKPICNEVPDLMKGNGKQDFSEVEKSKIPEPEITEPEEAVQTVLEPAEETKAEDCEQTQKAKVETSDHNWEPGSLEGSEKSELIAEFSEIQKCEAVVEDLEFEAVESLIEAGTETVIRTSKIRTPDYMSETVEEVNECQIIEVPNTSPAQTKEKDEKNNLEVEPSCEDGNAQVVDVMSDFMRDEFYENIPTSEDLPDGNSADEKVNDDKFRNIMQNCLENAKKFLNVGNLKLFSCSVDDLLELDNQENEASVNHISRDVLLTSCEDINDDLGLNEKFQPVDISMEFIPSDVCPEILPVDNWPYLEEEVPSSPLKSNETDLILENTVSEVLCDRKKTAKESENYKRFRRNSLVDDEQTLCSKIAAHRRKTIDSFLSYTKLNGIDKPNESLKCQLSLEKLTKNGVQFIPPQDEVVKIMKNMETNTKLNYKSPLWQPKVMLIRISEKEMKRFKRTRVRRRSFENLDSSPTTKKPKKNNADSNRVENEILLTIPAVDSVKGMITTSSDAKKHKPRFRNLHTKRKPDQEQNKSKAIETALNELFKDSDEESKNKSEKTNNDTEVTVKSEPKSYKHSSKYHSHKDKHDHRDRRGGSDKEQYKHKEKHRHERRKHYDERRHRSNPSDRERRRSILKNNGNEEVRLKDTWACEVCGFNDSNERVAHIKNHPFHCQSCHLAFKTEAYFTNHLTEMHKDIRNQHHCLLCELSFDTEEEYQHHLETREHTHLEAVEKNTINTLFTLLTGAPCPVLGVVEVKPEWLPNQPGTVHFYHQATPLSLALQYLKMHHDLAPCSEVPKVHPN